MNIGAANASWATPDVLVAGGGHAGLCAAITAREAGARVLLLDRAPAHMRGGNTRHTRNLRVAHDKPLHTLVGAYPADAFYQDLLRVTDGHTDATLARRMIDNSADLTHWLVARGVRFQPSLRGTLSLEATNAFFLGGGCALLNALYRHAEAIGVDVRYASHVTGLELDGDEFRAARVEADGDTHRVPARAFIAAAGGFQANLEWLQRAWGDAAQNFLIRGTPYNEGTLLAQMMDHGIKTTGDPAQCHAVAIDARAPKFDGGIVSRLDCVAFSIVVNKHAQRFYDEGEDFWPKRYAIWGRLVAQQPDQIAWAIYDDKVTGRFMPSIFPPITAQSPAALADALGLDDDTLTQTIETYNSAVVAGDYDPSVLDGCTTSGLTPNKTHWAQTIDTPPFHAYPLRPGITFTYLGLAVDEQARAQTSDGRPLANVYAAGEIMAGNILGQGYCAGTGMTIGGVFGRIAGAQAAAQL